MNKQKKNLAESIYYRLKNYAKEKNQIFEEILRYYAIERFLYRLSNSQYQNKFFLKGGLMFRVWAFADHRPTMDIDLLGRTSNDLENINLIIREICSQEIESDGLLFDLSQFKLTEMQVDGKYQGIRVIFHAKLHTATIHLQLDIGFNDEPYEPKSINYPTMLDFPVFELKSYSFESVIAEKFEAIMKLGMINTRMKDFFDIWTLSKQFEFSSEKLIKAFSITFNKRKTLIKNLPEAFTEKFYNDPVHQKRWKEFLKNIHFKGDIDFSFVIKELVQFLKPLIEHMINKNNFHQKWLYEKKWIEDIDYILKD
jgi:predicted nucleotidyltransferase component of viral defense system